MLPALLALAACDNGTQGAGTTAEEAAADGNLAAIKRRVKPDEHTAWALGEVEKLTAGATS